MSAKAQLEELADELSSGATNIWKYSDASPTIRERAGKKFGFIRDDETPLVLILASYVRRGSTGWLLTDQGIYWKQPLCSPMHLTYDALERVQRTDDTLTVHGPDGVVMQLDLSTTLLWCYSNRTAGEGLFELLKAVVELSSETSPPVNQTSTQTKAGTSAASVESIPTASTSELDAGQPPSVRELGIFVGVVIAGINHGVVGALIGAPVGLLLGNFLDEIVRDIWSKGRRRLNKITMPAAFVLSGACAWLVSRASSEVEFFLRGGASEPRDNVALLAAHYALPLLAAAIAAILTIRVGSAEYDPATSAPAPQSTPENEKESFRHTYSNLPTERLKELLAAPKELRPGAVELLREELERRRDENP